MHDLSTTVVAIATAPGRGGIGCVRVSGPDAGTVAGGLFRPAHDPGADPGTRPVFGHFLGREGEALDHGFLVRFPGSSSYTGESTVELWTHGSPPVLAELIETAIGLGAVPAEPGEFTYRAVRNGRLDLTRAEAVRDLIDSRTIYQARVALAQAEGSVARAVQPLREALEEWIARGEAAVEFVEESETHLPTGDLGRGIAEAIDGCERMLDGFRNRGRIVRDGARLVLVGRPNTGKSSLFNRLLAEDRAIVTELAGTTRDTLEETFDLDGIPVRLVDTAGLRDVDDRIESEGVRRAKQARADADLVLLVIDGTRPLDDEELRAVREAAKPENRSRTVVVVNKSDRPCSIGEIPHDEPLAVSALTADGLDRLRERLSGLLCAGAAGEDPIVTNGRHARALERTLAALRAATAAAADGMSEELVLEDLKLAMLELGGITGEFTTEEMYDRIFSRFCIGK